jgi:LPXTG-motif cell wall-anchored protein
VVGFVGALIGLWLARELNLPEVLTIRIGTQNFPIVWSIIGSALLLLVISLFTRRRRRVY